MKLLTHAERECPYWTRVFADLGLKPADIRNMEHFRRMPITTKTTIRENHDAMVAESWKGRTWKKSTGGSTGEPLHFEYTPQSSEWRQAVTLGAMASPCHKAAKLPLLLTPLTYLPVGHAETRPV